LTLVDTSVCVDHLRRGDAQLAALLERGGVAMHPFVLGEIACGSLVDRTSILELLHDLPQAVVAEADEVLGFIERHGVHGRGLGYVDVDLLVSTTLTSGTMLWTRDKRLRTVAADLGSRHPEAGTH
jgi:predicted nucleic acid-binding protein